MFTERVMTAVFGTDWSEIGRTIRPENVTRGESEDDVGWMAAEWHLAFGNGPVTVGDALQFAISRECPTPALAMAIVAACRETV